MTYCMYNRYISKDLKPQFIDYSSKFPLKFILNLIVETLYVWFMIFDKLNKQYNSQMIEVSNIFVSKLSKHYKF